MQCSYHNLFKASHTFFKVPLFYFLQPESINIEFDDIPWSELFVEFLFTTNEGHDQIVKSRLVKTWEKATTVEKRISDMKTVITKVDHKEV